MSDQGSEGYVADATEHIAPAAYGGPIADRPDSTPIATPWSIQRPFLASVILPAILAAILGMVLVLEVTDHRLRNDVLEQQETVASQYANALGPALWNFDFSNAQRILDGLRLQPGVSAGTVQVFGSTVELKVVGTTPADQGTLREVVRTVTYRNSDRVEEVGKLSIRFSDREVTSRTGSQAAGTSLILLVVIAVVSLSAVGAHRKLVAVPLATLHDAIRVGATITPRSPPPEEFQILFETYNAQQKRLAQEQAALHRAKDDAERANRTKTEFLAVIGHELRTPLNAVIGLSELLTTAGLEADQEALAADICSAGHQLLDLMDNIQVLTKLETGSYPYSPGPCRLDALCAEVAAVLRRRAQAKGIEISLEIDPALPQALILDPLWVRQVLVKLIDNAVKFTEKGWVTVFVKVCLPTAGQDWAIRVEVHDTGIGIASHDLLHLFGMFHQVDMSTRRRFEGAGIGLAICKRIVTAMGGTIGVASRLGKGSQFWFEMPMNPSGAMIGHGRNHLRSGRLNILLASTEPLHRSVIVTLTNLGHQIIRMAGEKVTNAVADGGGDLVLIDLDHPPPSALALTRAIRSLPGAAGAIPIVGIATRMSPDQVSQSLSAGMDSILSKPLLNGLRELLEQFRRPTAGATLTVGESPVARIVHRYPAAGTADGGLPGQRDHKHPHVQSEL